MMSKGRSGNVDLLWTKSVYNFCPGIQLSDDHPEEVWSMRVDDEEDEEEGNDRDYMLHQLLVRMVLVAFILVVNMAGGYADEYGDE